MAQQSVSIILESSLGQLETRGFSWGVGRWGGIWPSPIVTIGVAGTWQVEVRVDSQCLTVHRVAPSVSGAEVQTPALDRALWCSVEVSRADWQS